MLPPSLSRNDQLGSRPSLPTTVTELDPVAGTLLRTALLIATVSYVTCSVIVRFRNRSSRETTTRVVLDDPKLFLPDNAVLDTQDVTSVPE
jgi:hypothetical protein